MEAQPSSVVDRTPAAGLSQRCCSLSRSHDHPSRWAYTCAKTGCSTHPLVSLSSPSFHPFRRGSSWNPSFPRLNPPANPFGPRRHRPRWLRLGHWDSQVEQHTTLLFQSISLNPVDSQPPSAASASASIDERRNSRPRRRGSRLGGCV
jgi:hypothetical protein